MLKITSLQNPLVKSAISLRKKRDRDKLNLFLIEGYREIYYALEASRKIDTLFICQELFLGENENTLIKNAKKNGAKIIQCNKTVFNKISYRDRPDGLLAIAPKHIQSLKDLKAKIKDDSFIIIAESIEKPGNLGTILRSSDASGSSGVIICDRCTDIYNPNVVRASIGTLFTQPVVESTTDKVLCFLEENDFKIVAATPGAKAVFTKVDLLSKIAIVVGCEQYGLTDKWLKKADIQVKIPMKGKADSLNVSSATTLLLYEALRQRTSSVS